MADNTVSLSSEPVQRLLQCAVCLDRFKKPKILPCQHTFCLRPCLEGLVEHRTRSLRCPECRADHFLPREGVSGYPNNLTVIGFLELSKNTQPDTGRRSSDSQGSEAQQQPQRAASPLFDDLLLDGAEGPRGCYVCHAEGRISRCFHCDQVVCEGCRHTHMGQVKQDLTRLLHQVRRGLPQITEQVLSIGRKGTQLQNNCESVKHEVNEGITKHIQELKSRERILREDVDSFLFGELQTIRTYQEDAEVEIASLASFCDSAESVLSLDRPVPDGDLMEMKEQCQEYVDTIGSYENGDVRPPNVKQIQASLESTFLSSTIGTFGELLIKSRSQGRRDIPMNSVYLNPAHNLQNRQSGSSHVETRNTRTVANNDSSRAAARRRNLQANVDRSPPSERDTTSRWDNLTRDMRSQRRGRQERRSDPRLGARHRSLGTLSTTNEHVDENINDREETREHPEADVHSQEEMSASSVLSIANPGARSTQLFRPPAPSGVDFSNLMQACSSNSPSVYVDNPRNKYNQKGTAIVRFGKRGAEPKRFTWPRGVAVSPLNDNIFVSDSSNHRVQVFDNTGRYIQSFGSYGQGEAEFDCLAGIAVNGLGHLIIADRYNHRVQILDRNGRFQCSFGSEGSDEFQLSFPWGVACDNMGFIYVCDKENHRVQVFQSNGAHVRTFGSFGTHSGQFQNPHYIAVSPDNKVYVSDSSNHRIQVFSIYGDFLFSFGQSGTLRGQMKFPRGIAVDHQGFVVVADSGNNRIQIFRGDGRFYSMFGSWGSETGQFKGLEGVAILANGNIVVCDRENHRIQIF